MQVIERDSLDGLLGALRRRGYRTVGPVAARRGDRLRGDLLRRRPSPRLDRSPGRRDLPARAPRGRRAVRLRRRAALLEALPASASPAALQGAPGIRGLGIGGHRGGRGGRPATRSSACAPATCTRSRSRTGCWPAGPIPDPGYVARREGAFIVAVNCGQAAATCFCVSMDTGPRARVGLRPRAHRGARGRPPPLPRSRSAASAAPRCWPSVGRAAAEPGERGGRARRQRRAPPPRWGASSTPTGIKELLDAQPRASPLGRGRRALPDLRQLHDGLPDLLLHDGRGRHRPRRGGGRALARVGLLLHDSTSPTSTAAASAPRSRSRYRQWMTHKLGDLVRPVRHLGLRRLRALHHLVPGRRSTSPRRRPRSARPTATRGRSR